MHSISAFACNETRTDEALEDLANSAWDLYLGGLPNRILASSPEARAVIAHFRTCERELAKLLSISQTVVLRVRQNGAFATLRSTDSDMLFNVIGSNAEDTLRRADERARGFLDRRDAGTNIVLDDAKIDRILVDLTGAFGEQIRT